MSCVSKTIGHASTSAKRLKSAALPSITGIAASGPMLPSPSTAEPSETTATVLRLIVRRRASDLSAAIARQIRATPGVYARERSSRVFSGTFDLISSLPPRCKRNVRSLTLRTTRLGDAALIASVIASACSASVASHVTSITTRSWCDSTTSSAVSVPPACATAAGIRDVGEMVISASTRIVIP